MSLFTLQPVSIQGLSPWELATLSQKQAPSKGACHWVTLKEDQGGRPHHVCIAGTKRKSAGIIAGPFDEKTNPLAATSLQDMVKRVEEMVPGHDYTGLKPGMKEAPHAGGYYNPLDGSIHISDKARRSISKLVQQNKANGPKAPLQLSGEDIANLGILVHEMSHTASPVSKHMIKLKDKNPNAAARIFGSSSTVFLEEGINELRTRTALAQMVKDRTGQKVKPENMRSSYQMEYEQWALYQKKFGTKKVEAVWNKDTSEKRALEVNRTLIPYFEKSLTGVLTLQEIEKAKKGWGELRAFAPGQNMPLFGPNIPAWKLMGEGFLTQFERALGEHNGGKTPAERRALRSYVSWQMGLNLTP